MSNTFTRREPYAPRNHRSSGMLTHGGWRLRRHDITLACKDAPSQVSDALYAPGEALALSLLPQPAITPNRPGVGFLIRHSGMNQHYIILAWWDNQNELITRVLIKGAVPTSTWEDANGQYSFCVWDLEVFAAERNCYVRHVLTPPGGPDVEAYLTHATPPA